MKTKAEEWLKNNCKPEDWNNIEEDLADTMLTNNVIKYMESYARPTIEGKEEQAEWEFLTIIKANYEIAKRAEESDFAGMTKKEAVLELYDDLISIIERLPLKRPPLSQPSGTGKEEWVNEKPEFDKECVFITANKYIRNDEPLYFDYAVWQIKKLDGETENGEPAWYWGLLNGDGEEWGPLEDLSANWYLIIGPATVSPDSQTKNK